MESSAAADALLLFALKIIFASRFLLCVRACAFCTLCMQQLRVYERAREKSTHQNRYLWFVLRNSLRAVQDSFDILSNCCGKANPFDCIHTHKNCAT